MRGNAEKYGLDTSFIGITGYSSGGHLSALAGATNNIGNVVFGDVTVDIEGTLGSYTDKSSAVDAVVDWFGPIDMSRMENCSTYKGADSPEAQLIGGAPAENADMIAALNPMLYLDVTDPQFLVVHGDADTVVPYCQSQYFSQALEAHGKLSQFITVPNGEHGPVTFNEQTFAAMVEFFKQQASSGVDASIVGNDNDTAIYDLNGRTYSAEIDTLTPGIYVAGGRKILVRN